jgi:hypothetical protein
MYAFPCVRGRGSGVGRERLVDRKLAVTTLLVDRQNHGLPETIQSPAGIRQD